MSIGEMESQTEPDEMEDYDLGLDLSREQLE